jgi:YD repeat-containing protein
MDQRRVVDTYDGTHAWTAAGGDFDPTPISSAQVPAHHTGWVDWDGTKLVQQWITGGLANNGVLFKDQSGPAGPAGEEDFFSTSGTIPTQRPELDVVWQARTGAVDSYTFEHQALDAKTGADVNVANGNLLLSTQAISAAGTGVNLELDNYHNSLADPAALGAEGIRGTASLGRDVRLVPAGTGTVAFYRGDGYAGTFTAPQTTGSTTSYTAPLELPGVTLSLNTSTHLYTLVLPAGLPSLPGQPLTLTFAATGKLTKVADAAGHEISLGYYSANSTSGLPPLGSVLDTNSTNWDVDSNYTPDGYMDQITRPGGTTWNWIYGHLNGDYLTQFTAGDTGQAWHYDYDTSHRLSAITTPDAQVTKITYDGTSSKVASIINTTNPTHTTGPTTTYTYSSPNSPCQSTNFDYAKTVVSRPDSSSTTYCANNYAQVTYDTDNPTTATPSGEWYDLHDQYTQGTGTHSITMVGADAGAGVKKLSLQRGSGSEIAATTLPCDPRNAQNPTACPHTATATATFDPSAIPEGAQTFRVATTDYAGRTIQGAPWTVYIDRTAPGAVSGISALFDPDTNEADVHWDEPDDPVLPDGTVGAGGVTYRWRVSRDGGPVSGWQNVTDFPGFILTGSHSGEALTVDVQAVDAVGNAGAVTTSIVAAVPEEDGEDVADDDTTGTHDSIGVFEDEDSGATGFAPFAEPPPPPAMKHCGRNKYDPDVQTTFRVKLNGIGTTAGGDRYYQYHIHYQVRSLFRSNVRRTTLQVNRVLPNGSPDTAFDDSDTRIGRLDPKPYYGHFLRLKVQPSSQITYFGHFDFKDPIPTPLGNQTGGHYRGSCLALLSP